MINVRFVHSDSKGTSEKKNRPSQGNLMTTFRHTAPAIIAVMGASFSAFAQSNTIGVTVNEAGIAPGYTLFAPLTATNNTYLIDSFGRVINSWTSSYRAANSVYLNEEGDLIRTLNPGGSSTINGGAAGGRVERRNWDNQVEWTWSHISNSYRLHHDIEVMPNGNILMIAWESKSSSQASAAGRQPGTFQGSLWPDKIIEVQPSGTTGGTIVWEWHAWDHLIQDYNPSLPNYGDPAEHPHRIDVNFRQSNNSDWMHCNGLDYNAELDQIVISSRSFNEIWVIDHDTTTEEAAGPAGDLLYRWGNPRAYGRGSSSDQKLFGQHDPRWIRAGMPGYPGITIFNNGNGRPGTDYTSIDQIDPPILKNGTYEIGSGDPFGPEELSWEYVAPNPSSFYSSFISGAERQANGNTLICSGANGQFFEVDEDGNELWRYITPFDNGGPMNQGENPPSGGGGGPGGGAPNTVFRAERYAPDFAGFDGKNMFPGAPIEIYPACPADLNHDRMVDGADLALVLVAWNSTADTSADLNGDQLVDGADLALVLVAWGFCP